MDKQYQVLPVEQAWSIWSTRYRNEDTQIQRVDKMNPKLKEIQEVIESNIKDLTQSDSFCAWFENQKKNEGDWVIMNNSFIFRKTKTFKTRKNKYFLGFPIKKAKPDFDSIFVSTPSDFDTDFRIIQSMDTSRIGNDPLEYSINSEVQKLGQLVFFLIGKLIEIPTSVSIQSKFIKELRFDPTCSAPDLVNQDGNYVYIVNQLNDPEGAWNTTRPKIEDLFGKDVISLQKAFFLAHDELRKEAKYHMVLPESISSKTDNTFINELIKSISEQRRFYELALEKYMNGQDAENNFREILRISYNFSNEAIRIIQLLVSICDLKPVLLWSTIKSHFDLVEALRSIPIIKSEKKGNTEEYINMVHSARNHAFHNLLPFDRSIEADLTGIQMNARKLTLLPSYTQREKAIAFDYEDREMVEILKEFTRADETKVSLEFWQRNGDLIRCFETLLIKTEDAMWLINNARE